MTSVFSFLFLPENWNPSGRESAYNFEEDCSRTECRISPFPLMIKTLPFFKNCGRKKLRLLSVVILFE
jgi:hypothetical protein